MASKLPLLLLLIAITCLSQFYRVSNSVIAPELTRDLGLSARQLGWAGSAFFFALFAVQVPVGMWFDRYGARRTVAVEPHADRHLHCEKREEEGAARPTELARAEAEVARQLGRDDAVGDAVELAEAGDRDQQQQKRQL